MPSCLLAFVVLDEYRMEVALKILRRKNISEQQILGLYGENKKDTWNEEDHKINELLLSLAKNFQVDSDAMIDRCA